MDTLTPNLLDDSNSLSARELERLHQILHAATDVKRRSHFFLWAQGQLQSLIPHDVLICGHGDVDRRSLVFDHFSRDPIAAPDLAGLLDVDDGLATRALSLWAERGQRPFLADAADAASGPYRQIAAALQRHRFATVVAHGTPSTPGWPGTYFVFAGLPSPMARQTAYLADLLLPQLHVAYVRMTTIEHDEMPQAAVPDRLITPREVEILGWIRNGKSNEEIGRILDISPLTVKNHVQKILRKLNVQNRAQAVARGIALRLIPSTSA
ncbi:MAG: XrtB/PEP-CTERM-associated transcriptional regulator EpsA [Burkholderiales bacterium]